MANFINENLFNMLARMDAVIGTRACPSLTRELVYARVRQLRQDDGYAQDVALSIALKEHGFSG